MSDRDILTVAQMQAAEQKIFDAGTTVSELMEIAAGGAAEWIRRIAAGRSVTVLCGPGNNGGDGYVIARRLREAGNAVQVVAPISPKTDAGKSARTEWGGDVSTSGGGVAGEVFVDCLFGSGLSRPLSGEHSLLLRDLAERHSIRIAIDLPSGVESDSGALLNDRLPHFDVTLALGAWKFAHWLLPARTRMGVKRLVPIGVSPTEGAAQLIERPELSAPADTAHKYTRGLAVIVDGEMPGASVLAARAAQSGGAGYVKLFSEAQHTSDPAIVQDSSPLSDALSDERINAVLIGPGLGRSSKSEERLTTALRADLPTVIDADALVLLRPEMLTGDAPRIATPHDGELAGLCKSFAVIADGRIARARALAKAAGMVICAKGPDTVIAAPDGRLALAPPAPSWLSVAGSGDVLAGIAVSRMAAGRDAFEAACEAVWIHGEAARRTEAPFTAMQLANSVQNGYAACL
ncbi:NAD(P)H-hydrate dehydratase [Erythrobacter rubeus]|uniref:Bifunctional NAD(P)H-hydrate repair enzyme n=1 Tax=Erythrobacter rubeus TaxID=2760803 RepID=A0ABR8KP81_9SPHN|nr:NAD(P)H-hydrate dehydratase [Erythrobacter rubeus]MBD2841664.1 NAD(P)H-hydrate dehydratase [Erythrobacter rubeus]